MIYKVRIPKEKELTLVVSRLLRKGYTQKILVTNKPDGLIIDTKEKRFEYIDAESVIDFEELNGTPILPSELDREVFKVRKIAMDKQDLLICNHCKKIWTGLIDRCNCGCTTLTKTHESNRKYACNNSNLLEKYENLCNLAEARLVEIVRDALKKERNQHVSHAVCAMGHFFFVGDYAIYGKNGILDNPEGISYAACKFIRKWDDICKLTGMGAKIYRDKIVTDF